MNKENLDIQNLQKEAKIFSEIESEHDEPSIFGSTDGKAVGTYLEHKFKNFLAEKYAFENGNSASGIDLPGLGYNLLVFVYKKEDNQETKTSRLYILHTIFVEKNRTADFQLTTSISKILDNGANEDDIIALFQDKNLPVDEITASSLSKEILSNRPEIGYLTISNALQWRLQYSRIIEEAGKTEGINRLV